MRRTLAALKTSAGKRARHVPHWVREQQRAKQQVKAAKSTTPGARGPPRTDRTSKRWQDPLVQPTASPWVWASGALKPEEVPAFSDRDVAAAAAFFRIHGTGARFVPPSEFNYELPSRGVPEIAFAGRSNVGKSSLLSALLGRRKIVRVSKTPGCTGSVNYFSLGPVETCTETSGTACYLVDLPGFGYAKVSKANQLAWSRLLTDFLSHRGFMTLRRCLVLLDSRRGPELEDWRLMESLSASSVAWQLVLTKADLSSPLERQARSMQVMEELREWRKIRPTHMPTVHCVSAATGEGLGELKVALAQAAGIKFPAR